MSFPRYPKYKPSGVEWLGDVPEEWGVSRLKNSVKDIYSGGTPETGNPEYWALDENDSIPWVAIGDMTRAAVVDKTDKRITRAGLASKRLRVLPKGTLLYSMYASLGKVAVLAEPATINQAILGIIPDSNKLAQNYLLYWLIQIERHLSLFSSSNTQDNLNAEKVRSLPLLIPNREEQMAIAEFLNLETAKIDELVAEQRGLMELLEEKRWAVISHAVTKGLNPHASMKPSGIEWLGDVPDGWEVGPLKRYWSVTDCKHVTAEFVDDGIPVASIREVQSRWVTLTNAKRTTKHYYEVLIEGGRRPSPGDLIFSRNATVGEVAQVNAELPQFAMGQDVVLLRKLSGQSSSDYLQHVIRSPVITEQLACMMIGSTFKRINVEDIRSLMVPVPPCSEQAAIAAFIEAETDQFDTLTAEAQQAIDLLQERRTALISAAVTGQIDVRQQTRN